MIFRWELGFFLGVPFFQTPAATLRGGDLQPAQHSTLRRGMVEVVLNWVRKSGYIPEKTSNDHVEYGEMMIHHKIWGSNV